MRGKSSMQAASSVKKINIVLLGNLVELMAYGIEAEFRKSIGDI